MYRDLRNIRAMYQLFIVSYHGRRSPYNYIIIAYISKTMRKILYECIMNKQKHGIMYINQTSKICLVTTTQHIWRFLGQKSQISNPLFAQFQILIMPDFAYDILRQRVNLKITMKFLECIHIIVLSWKRDLTKRDCNLKLQKYIFSIEYWLSRESLDSLP